MTAHSSAQTISERNSRLGLCRMGFWRNDGSDYTYLYLYYITLEFY
jgi:hypothetical protein